MLKRIPRCRGPVGDPRAATARRRRLLGGCGSASVCAARAGAAGASALGRTGGTSPGPRPRASDPAPRGPVRGVSSLFLINARPARDNISCVTCIALHARAPGEQLEETPSIPCSIQTPPRYRTRAEREPPRAGLHRAYTPSLHAQLVEREPCLPPTVVEQL
jgi:hypothetical protein